MRDTRRPATGIILGLVLLNFYMHPGPLTWLLDHLYNWWAGVLFNGR